MSLTLPPPKLARAALARVVQRPAEDLQVQVLWTLLWPQPTRISLAREPKGQRWLWLARRCQLDPAVVEAVLTELLAQPELVVVTPHHDEWGRKLGDWLYAAEPLRAAFRAELAKADFTGWAAAEVKAGDWAYLADVAKRMDRVLDL